MLPGSGWALPGTNEVVSGQQVAAAPTRVHGELVGVGKGEAGVAAAEAQVQLHPPTHTDNQAVVLAGEAGNDLAGGAGNELEPAGGAEGAATLGRQQQEWPLPCGPMLTHDTHVCGGQPVPQLGPTTSLPRPPAQPMRSPTPHLRHQPTCPTPSPPPPPTHLRHQGLGFAVEVHPLTLVFPLILWHPEGGRGLGLESGRRRRGERS